MHDSNYQELFYPEYWRRLALGQRVRLLQDLENDHASQSGRSPYTVKPVPMPTFGACGKMDPDKREILVNETHIQHDPLEFSAIHTVLHEGRHAYQKAAIDNPALHHNREQTQVWKENAAAYIQNSEKMLLVYWNQPIERDAQEYAYDQLIKIADRLEQKHGKIEQYQRYITTVETEARFMAEKSRAKYGDDYILKIDKALRQAYSITKGLDGDKLNAREVTAMESTVNFDVTIEKEGQKVQEMIAVKPFHDLRHPKGFAPHFYNPDAYGHDALAANDKDRVDLVRSIEEKVFTRATEAFGKDLNGLSVDIRPNYNSLVNDKALVQECIDIAKETNPEIVSDIEAIARFSAKVEQSIAGHKSENAEYFPGHENIEIAGGSNGFIKDAIQGRIEGAKDTYSAVYDAGLNIRDTIKGYKAAHDKNINLEPYFIIINKPGEEPLAKTVGVDKNISQDELKEFLKKEANGFINEHVRNTDDLNGMSVRAEKADDLSSEGQREFYRQIGSLGIEKGFESSIEIAR